MWAVGLGQGQRLSGKQLVAPQRGADIASGRPVRTPQHPLPLLDTHPAPHQLEDGHWVHWSHQRHLLLEASPVLPPAAAGSLRPGPGAGCWQLVLRPRQFDRCRNCSSSASREAQGDGQNPSWPHRQTAMADASHFVPAVSAGGSCMDLPHTPCCPGMSLHVQPPTAVALMHFILVMGY